jgi:hypothetical protein
MIAAIEILMGRPLDAALPRARHSLNACRRSRKKARAQRSTDMQMRPVLALTADRTTSQHVAGISDQEWITTMRCCSKICSTDEAGRQWCADCRGCPNVKRQG